MGDRIERAQLAARLMVAHGRLGNTGHGIYQEYQPLGALDESGNTVVITFHVDIVAIPPNCCSQVPSWAGFGKAGHAG